MHIFTFLPLSLVASQALGFATEPVTFETRGASIEAGFTIPKEARSGVYSVQIDSNGVAHHTKIRDLSTEAESNTRLAGRNVATEGSHNIQKRDEVRGGGVTCGGGSRFPEDPANRVVHELGAQCRGGRMLDGGAHYYVIHDYVAAYFCNFGPGTAWCDENANIYEDIINRVSGTCGSFQAGWTNWENWKWDGSNPDAPYQWMTTSWSTGYQWVDDSKSFCGSTHF